MAFDNHEWRRKEVKNSLLYLEDRKEKLEDEIRHLQKPSANRMLAESLGTSNKGYQFQKMLLVLVQDQRIMAYEVIDEVSESLVEMNPRDIERQGIYRVGNAFYRKRRFWDDDQSFEHRPEVANIPRHDIHIPTFFINGRYYYIEQDGWAQELLNENIYDDFDVTHLPNGIYQVLAEMSQYGGGVDYWGEYDEGIIESEYKVYESVPLYEFLSNKDDLIAEADPEAEEMAERYVYIQQTVQRRFKKKERTYDDFNREYNVFRRRNPDIDTSEETRNLLGTQGINPAQNISGVTMTVVDETITETGSVGESPLLFMHSNSNISMLDGMHNPFEEEDEN